MPDSFIDQIIERADANDWCMKYGCTTCGAYKFRAEIELVAVERLITKLELSEDERSTNFVRELENLKSDISRNSAPITGLNKNNRFFTNLFPFIQTEVINDLKKSDILNEDAIRIVLNDYDLESNTIEFEGNPIGDLIKYFIRNEDELKIKFLPKKIRIIVIDVKRQNLSYKIVDGPFYGNSESVEIAIEESDRETESNKVEIKGMRIGIVYGCGSRDLTGHFWRLKPSDNLYFGNTALLCEDDTSVEYGPFYGQDCPIELEDLIELIEWGKMSMDSPEYEWTRDATMDDIVRNG